MIKEPEDNSERPQPIPFLFVRWLIRLAVITVVLGFAWTIYTSGKRIQAEAKPGLGQASVASGDELGQWRGKLAEVERKEEDLWNRAEILTEVLRRYAKETNGPEPDPIDDERLAQLRGRLVQAQIRRDRLLEIVTELETQIEALSSKEGDADPSP